MEKDTAAAESRSIFIVTGRVQGVGFRPHVYRVALSCCLCGSVRNTDRGVRIEVQGAASSIERFALRLRADLPPLARISSLEREDVPFDPSLPESFVIEERRGEGDSGQPGYGHVRQMPCRHARPCRSAVRLCLHQLHGLRPALQHYPFAAV